MSFQICRLHNRQQQHEMWSKAEINALHSVWQPFAFLLSSSIFFKIWQQVSSPLHSRRQFYTLSFMFCLWSCSRVWCWLLDPSLSTGVLTHTCTEHCWSAQSLPQSTWIDWLSFQFRPFIVFSISSSVARLSHSVNFICFAAMSVRQPVCGCYCPLIGFADFCALKLSLWDSRRCLTCVTTSVLFISVIRVANVWVCVYLWHSRVHQRQVI